MPDPDRDWRARAGSPFATEKRPATGARGMVVTNHPLASAAGAEMLAGGGNAVDAAVAALFALTIVEPMMVGLVGGGMTHVRDANGGHTVIDGLSTIPAAARPDMYRPVTQDWPGALETEGRANAVGALSVAVPGNLLAWCEALRRFGSLSLDDVMQPAIRLAARGFPATPYLAECAAEAAPDMARDGAISAVFLPGGAAVRAGQRVVQAAAAEALATIAREGPGALHGGAIGAAVATDVARRGGILSEADLRNMRTVERVPLRGDYRGVEIVLPPPPASSGVHVTQMLNLLEGFDLRALGFGTAATTHLIAEALKMAFADRLVATADPAFVQVPVARLMSKAYAAERRALLDTARARAWGAGVAAGESANTTHVTVADGAGRIVAATHTVNSLFGARFMVGEVGLIPNNYMALFDPRPGHAQSIVPGKRITTSQAPLIALRDGRPSVALGLPGGAAHLRRGDAGGDRAGGPRHDPAGGGGGAARLDPGDGAWAGAGGGGRLRARGAGRIGGDGTRGDGAAACRGRHVRHPLPQRRHAGRRSLLARRRHGDRSRRRAGASRGAVLAGPGAGVAAGCTNRGMGGRLAGSLLSWRR